MRLVVQRVSEAELWIDDKLYSSIGRGILALLGIESNDKSTDINYLVDKLINLRIFPDENDVMNHSLMDIAGELLIVSQFTLYGDCRKGRRPSYSNAMTPNLAEPMYNEFVEKAKSYKLNVQTGKFQAMMDIKLTNWGPVTLLLDSKKVF
ncbi:MAG: D-aminoacyl-tRNA deacylase [Spirochaetota bacterium]|nr:D-aminoacyl-tRNA deacylase [Spirochaetota bacterium]